MALIQISDPDSSPSIKKQFSVGIDLGTSNSLIAESINKKVTFFKSDRSELIPSVVYESNKKLLVGDPKESQSVKSIKRLMGLSSQEVSSLKVWLSPHSLNPIELIHKIQVLIIYFSFSL